MEALVPALIAALLAGIGDRPAWLAAILGDRFQRPGLLLFGAIGAQAMIAAVAVAGGAFAAPFLTPNAAQLLLALALAFAGIAALWRPRMPDRLDSWHTGALATAFLGIFSLAVTDRTMFLTFALAARGPDPALAGVGAVLGTTILSFAAIAAGETVWRRVARRRISRTAGVILIVFALFLGLGALHIL